jgi:hypothetical protein
VRNSIISFKNTELDDFNSKFKISRLLRRIDDSESSIEYSDAVAVIEKRFTPQVGAARNYTINFGTPLSREDSQYRFYSAPAFKQFDDEFNLRSCFFEETPGTSSGIDSVTIISTSASKIYDQETPTVTISGDGVGAIATAVVVNGKITSIKIEDPGVNYTTATAFVTYLGEVDATVVLSVNIQNRYGVIRSFYIDETNKVKTTLNANAGTIDYLLGKVTLTNFDPVSIEDPLKIFRLIAKPQTNNFESSRNRIITIDDEDAGSITVTMKTVD